MTWQNKPKIEANDHAGITLLRFRGDLMSDMPRDWQQAVIDELDARCDNDRVVIDVASLDRLGSWGEKRIKSFAGRVVGAGGHVAVVTDPHRSPMFAGLRAELAGIKPTIPIVEDRNEALTSLKVAK